METSLLTFDGFPRSDIDVAQIRFIRARIVRLRNDYRQVMDRIEAELRDRYASVGADDESMANNSVVFARVTLIEPDSPASLAVSEILTSKHKCQTNTNKGFQLNDGIIQFGSIDATNHNGLQSLPVLVGNKKNQPIAVKISRNDETLDLSLTPQEWSGRGLIGFKLDLV
ncbi:unnamed protein product [Kuraishia capsulata CBS 1993]|uniref:Probable 26S proteasome regulatory subunit p27 n=1 Tax=Kuraishia capsulata CBS 1993 TaxID=1382522 RepID=W6MKF3_9ASCO|nr:uncharacterized protein KUCA_T00002450001 [Kuraishia capsulata CBS 1993]CDK26478.1 unnamed protein product [Kuraishia capsulata CBS 1993]